MRRLTECERHLWATLCPIYASIRCSAPLLGSKYEPFCRSMVPGNKVHSTLPPVQMPRLRNMGSSPKVCVQAYILNSLYRKYVISETPPELCPESFLTKHSVAGGCHRDFFGQGHRCSEGMAAYALRAPCPGKGPPCPPNNGANAR